MRTWIFSDLHQTGKPKCFVCGGVRHIAKACREKNDEIDNHEQKYVAVDDNKAKPNNWVCGEYI